jgi:hypothetical protein
LIPTNTNNVVNSHLSWKELIDVAMYLKIFYNKINPLYSEPKSVIIILLKVIE